MLSASAFDSERCLEKNEAFDAVMGVLGVFALFLRGGGVIIPLEGAASGSEAIFDAVGVLNGSRFRGGRRRGCKLFFFTCCGFLCSVLPEDTGFLI